MKTKLLKKVRKRFSTEYYPNGRYIYNRFYNTPVMYFKDIENSDNNEYYFISEAFNERVAYRKLYKNLLQLIIKEYSKYGTRRNKIRREVTDNPEKLWWK